MNLVQKNQGYNPECAASTARAPSTVSAVNGFGRYSANRFGCVRRGLSLLAAGAAFYSSVAVAEMPQWMTNSWDTVSNTVSDVWHTGTPEVIVPLRTHHIRRFYTQEKIDTYQEQPWGLGFAKSKINDKGNYEGLFALVFQDSHFKPEYHIGYEWQARWTANDWFVGVGYTVGLLARSDIWHYKPFPGAIPVVAAGYKAVSLNALYLPGGKGNGNVIFAWGTYRF